MTKVRVSAQLESFVKSLAPDPRKALRTGIKSLAAGQGDIKHLEGDLAGWSRLRVQTYRVVFKEIWKDGHRIVDAFMPTIAAWFMTFSKKFSATNF